MKLRVYNLKHKHVKSLSTKIVLFISITSLLSIFVILSVFAKTNQEAFYNIELEKADLIAKTVEPILALNIYLGMKDKIDQFSLKLIENPDILSVKILKNKDIISEVKSKNHSKYIGKSFIINKTIFMPNSKKEIGTLVLVYSYQNYKELMNKYTNMYIIILIVFVILSLLFGLYVKKLLTPIKKMALSLKGYSPNKKIEFPDILQNNEIGLISKALSNMQERILNYSKEQKNINQYLEEKVNDKTLELRNQLYTDSLTGLKNRFSLINNISKTHDGALLILNIDYFREINDFYGHFAGDIVLKAVSKDLIHIFRNNLYVEIKRLASDEFAVLFTRKPLKDVFIKAALEIVEHIEKTVYFYENTEISIRITIGGAYQIKNSIEKADIALKAAKKQQKSFLIYDEKLNIEEEYKNNMEWVTRLKSAISQNRIVPFFQPIFDNQSNKIASYECLVRLIDTNGDIISPFKFLGIAKKSKLYSVVSKIMFEKSCKKFEHLECDFSVNISVDDILDNTTVEFLKEQIQKYNVHNKIILEILESEEITNFEEVMSFIKDVKALGCRIAIDDFGSGYSNFEYLLKLKVDYIKIDGSLIKNLDSDKNAKIVVETIVDFAKKLNLLTVAEFVHNEAVYEKVKEYGISRTQGYFLAEPKENTL